MAVVVSLPLYGSPDRELEEKTGITGPQLRQLATALQERLHQAAALLDQLRAAGWTAQAASYDLLLTHPAVQAADQAVQRLRGLGIDPELFLIMDEPEEDEG